jgi:hypothetical protein
MLKENALKTYSYLKTRNDWKGMKFFYWNAYKKAPAMRTRPYLHPTSQVLHSFNKIGIPSLNSPNPCRKNGKTGKLIAKAEP